MFHFEKERRNSDHSISQDSVQNIQQNIKQKGSFKGIEGTEKTHKISTKSQMKQGEKKIPLEVKLEGQ